jgi:hypothetical protein
MLLGVRRDGCRVHHASIIYPPGATIAPASVGPLCSGLDQVTCPVFATAHVSRSELPTSPPTTSLSRSGRAVWSVNW